MPRQGMPVPLGWVGFDGGSRPAVSFARRKDRELDDDPIQAAAACSTSETLTFILSGLTPCFGFVRDFNGEYEALAAGPPFSWSGLGPGGTSWNITCAGGAYHIDFTYSGEDGEHLVFFHDDPPYGLGEVIPNGNEDDNCAARNGTAIISEP